MSDYDDDLFDDTDTPNPDEGAADDVFDVDDIARLAAAGDDTGMTEATEIAPPERPVSDDARAFTAAATAGAITQVDTDEAEPAPKRGRRSKTMSDRNADAAKIRRPGRKADTAASAPTQTAAPRTVPLTSFDFLGGEFARARKGRLMSLGLIGAIGIVSLILIQLGVGAYLGRQAVADQIETLRAEHETVTRTYNDLTTIGGVSAVELDGHVQTRISELTAATGVELDTVTLLREYLVNPVTDSTITAISLSVGAPAAGAGEDTTTTTTAPDAAAAPAGGSAVTVKFTVAVQTHEALAAWLSRIEASPGFDGVYPSINTPTTIEVTGTITAATSPRHTSLVSSITPSTDVSDATSATGGEN